MQKYKLDILGLSEVRWTGQERITSGQTTVLYSGREEHHHRVGILLNKNAAKTMIGWKQVSKRIITARFATRHAKGTVVQVYAPTESASDCEKDRFYKQLQDELNSIPSYIILVIGDFNAKINDNRRGLYTMIGSYGSANLTTIHQRHRHIQDRTDRQPDSSPIGQAEPFYKRLLKNPPMY